ncbi:pentatricopeptide repeat-containing protein At1g80550, mitochondrial-like [Lolium rigidum]|uniref:pentatricopeptide repeat-containing protein At1g80550, mitochondrial-like n=1 Tax=Lolium rigidum TaxID=89674 RepID=UPI001F5DC340|nr:pentatricopeptide repeat-containing protein At1g80550, mitochondrial-like [Lolium rigidum]
MLSLVRRRLLALPFSTAPAPAPPSTLDAAAVLETLSLYTNDWRRALDFFHWSASPDGANLPPTPSTLSRAVDILGKHFEFPLATSLLLAHHHPADPSFLRPALRALLNRLAAANLVDDAVRAFDSTAHSLGLRDEASFHLLLDALCDHRRVDEAHHLCFGRAPPPFPPGTKTHNLLLRGWAKTRAWTRLRQHWLDMDTRGVAKDLHSYSIYMDALAKSGKPWKAVKVFKEMKHKRIPVDVVAYNTAIHAVGLAEGVDFAIRLYRQMIEAGCKPNAATFNTIVKLLCKEGRFKEAYAFVPQMHKAGCAPNVLTYHCFFQYLSRPQEVLGLFEKMLERGCRPRMDTYVMLIKRFGRWGFLRPVFFVWKTMEEQGLSPDAFAYNTLIDALLEKGMVDMARKYDEEMLAKGLSPKPRKELGTKAPGADSDSDNALGGVF